MKNIGQVLLRGLVLMAVVLPLVACGGDGDASAAQVTQSCTQKLQPSGYTLCQEVTSAKEIVAQVLAQCSSGGGTLSNSGCSTDNSLGKCTISDAHGSTSSFLYKPATTTDAQTLCGQMGGTFSS